MSGTTVSLGRQVSAVETLIAIVNNQRTRPKPAQMQMLVDDARAAAETLKSLPSQFVAPSVQNPRDPR